MPGPINTLGQVNVTALTDSGATEKVVLTVNGVNTNNLQTAVQLEGYIELTTAAAGTTAVVVKARRGTTIAGTQVGASITITATTAAKEDIAFLFQDTPGEVFGQSYVITVTETGAGANGTIDNASVQASVTALN
jgi:hypothetical protein